MLLILDLDETLIHATEQDLGIPFAYQVGKYKVYLRSCLHEFLETCHQHFELAIWSSATEDYIGEIVQNTLPAHVKFSFIWGRNRCTPIISPRVDEYGYYNMDISSYYEYAKKLHKLKRKGYSLDQILMVDDTPAKLVYNYGNAIYIKPFTGLPTDQELPKLAQYLLTLQGVLDVRAIEKRGWSNNFGSLTIFVAVIGVLWLPFLI